MPVGLVNVQFDDDEIATVAYSVFPAWRGRGIARLSVRAEVGAQGAERTVVVFGIRRP